MAQLPSLAMLMSVMPLGGSGGGEGASGRLAAGLLVGRGVVVAFAFAADRFIFFVWHLLIWGRAFGLGSGDRIVRYLACGAVGGQCFGFGSFGLEDRAFESVTIGQRGRQVRTAVFVGYCFEGPGSSSSR